MRPAAGRVPATQKRQQGEAVDAVVRPGRIDGLRPPAFFALPLGQMVERPIDRRLDAQHLPIVGQRRLGWADRRPMPRRRSSRKARRRATAADGDCRPSLMRFG